MMGHLEKALLCVRSSIMGLKTWDYCVVWTLADDSLASSSIDWMDCCCCGGEDGERGGSLSTLCRDTYNPHLALTKACEALAKKPKSMLLCSGIHGEVIVSSEPRWIHHIANISDLEASRESIGTQLLIPIVGGLVELFAAKHVPKNQEMIEFVTSQFNLQPFDSFLGVNPSIWVPSFHEVGIAPQLQHLVPVAHLSDSSYFEKSSKSSPNVMPSDEHESSSLGLGSVSQNSYLKQPLIVCSGSKRVKRDEDIHRGCDNYVIQRDRLNVHRRPDKERYRSKNLLTERALRCKIRDGLYALRAIVPKITKMDRASILGDAIDYIKELQVNVKMLQDELKDLTEQDCKISASEQKMTELNWQFRSADSLVASRWFQGSFHVGARQPVEAHVEVKRLGTRDFLLKIVSENKHGAFTRLLGALTSLGLQVIDANVTSHNGVVSNILTVQANESSIQAKDVRDSLMKLAAK
ncbi:hypothetical protein Ancab_020506 [Ancistrocladus abbreviatus]